MKFSPLAVHCASLCFDVIQSNSFKELSHCEIEQFYEDIYGLIQQRTALWPEHHQREHEFIDSVTCGVLKALHICRDKPQARDAEWLLSALESRIDFSIKQLH
ncbi:hypothetical protein DI392_00080 [Vibrio albus]|uniref:Uncharacterized protein n=1 Tax=Vibrio albus TaxID=2200953 RepID=A0A2U3BD93_9VIBR|nr:hypothetical protein [Vibrio albus]PWI34722.1 hypothetical protein DI392_00080 [Vibrio albus]